MRFVCGTHKRNESHTQTIDARVCQLSKKKVHLAHRAFRGMCLNFLQVKQNQGVEKKIFYISPKADKQEKTLNHFI